MGISGTPQKHSVGLGVIFILVSFFGAWVVRSSDDAIERGGLCPNRPPTTPTQKKGAKKPSQPPKKKKNKTRTPNGHSSAGLWTAGATRKLNTHMGPNEKKNHKKKKKETKHSHPKKKRLHSKFNLKQTKRKRWQKKKQDSCFVVGLSRGMRGGLAEGWPLSQERGQDASSCVQKNKKKKKFRYKGGISELCLHAD